MTSNQNSFRKPTLNPVKTTEKEDSKSIDHGLFSLLEKSTNVLIFLAVSRQRETRLGPAHWQKVWEKCPDERRGKSSIRDTPYSAVIRPEIITEPPINPI